MIIVWIVIAIVVLFGVAAFFGAPYVPSLPKDLAAAFDKLYPLSKSDVVVDIGSGDGIVLRHVAKRGAKAVGYEINPFLVLLSKLWSWNTVNVQTKHANLWRAKFPIDTTLVYTFTVSRDVNKLSRKLQSEANRLQKPLHFISYGIELKDKKPIKSHGAHHLYLFSPLQGEKPQV